MKFKVGDTVYHKRFRTTGIIEIIGGELALVRVGRVGEAYSLSDLKLMTPNHVCLLICKCNAKEAVRF